MHPVVSDEPYEFVPPYRGNVWPWVLQGFTPWWLSRQYGIVDVRCEGVDHLKASIDRNDGIVLAPNHCRPSDPLVVTAMCRHAGVVPFTMASWHLFIQGRFKRFVLRRSGAFSVYREGVDRQGLQAGVEILRQAKRPLVIFPEGVITRTNDRVLPLMDGVSFVARSAAKKRGQDGDDGRIVVHPVAIRYHFGGDIETALHETLDAIEQRLSWRPQRDPDLVKRIYRVGEALLWLKEIEYLRQPQHGEFPDRLERLIDRILVPLEQEWLEGKRERTTVGRVKKLRIAILRRLVSGNPSAEDRQRCWEQLADMYLAQQLSHYPPQYVRSDPTPERMLETVEKFEEDLTDVSRIHRPMSATIRVGQAIVVSPDRNRGVKEDPVTAELYQRLHELLGLPTTGPGPAD
jgi:1-acyl-sn-glycerol-3-phosphate acyltransferase